ncbi:MAG: sigma 54-interacting transcriptional regulator [Deltaproteobacteria bacterium]|nr:sigma 54-interacting transcriptional regulator [Deltaproteobacteria bacterium]
MPTLVLEAPGQPKRHVKIFKALTSIGASEETDVQIPRAGLEPTHAQIAKEGDAFFVVGMTRDMTVNGRREKRRRLEDGDVVRIGDLTMTWHRLDVEPAPPVLEPRATPPGEPLGVTREVIGAYRHIHQFSLKLYANESTSALVETLLDGVIELTGADKGFLVLLDDDGRPQVRAARNVDRANLDPTVSALSDSIVRRVIETRQPLVVADALRDESWNASASVVNLQLLSVMCCPLLDREELIGLLYVGNNRVARIFDESALDVMSVFAAQAGLLLSHARRIEELTQAKTALEDELEGMRFGSIVGACESMKEVFRRIRKVATADVSVLITGETGTGKELIALELHQLSRRAKGPFVVINCGAIPENLLESELFGHVRGAFTGAVATKVGRFQAANGGTLFLDEIGELPLSLQVKLLRALQEHVVIKVGDTRPEHVDIRVLAATNRVLEDEIKAGRFREDLYYRLNVVNVHLPPLRERGEDLVIIARYLLAKALKEQGGTAKGFSKSCLNAMRRYRWPGNIRQLENRIRKAVVLADRPLLTAEDMDLQPEDLEEILPLTEARARFEARYISEVLERNAGNRTKTARDLGVDPRTIFRHLAKQAGPNPIDPETGEVGVELEAGDENPPRP